MNEFEKKAASIFARFTEKLAKVKLVDALLIPAAVGAAVVLAGAGVEVHGQNALLQHGGFPALDAYQHAMAAVQLPFRDWMQQGLSGTLPSFGDNTEVRGIALTAVAPVVGAVSVLLARGFGKLKGMLSERRERLREDAIADLHPQLPPDEQGRFEWARTRAAEGEDGGSWRDRERAPAEVPNRIGTIEMLQRLALAHRVNARDLTLENGQVRHLSVDRNGVQSSRPICQVGSAFWNESERDALIVHRIARAHQLDAEALYVREGVVYERNDEAFVDRTVCRIDSPEWNLADRELLSDELDVLFAPSAPIDAVKSDLETTSRARLRNA